MVSIKDDAKRIYGHIELWDTSLITNMSELFQNKYRFIDDISYWNVSNVDDMCYMFRGAKKFNISLNK